MKKLLLASTALVMSAGYAAADVSLSGNARMGLLYDGSDVRFTSRARVIFTLSGETDTGLAFGASFRADQAGAANNSGDMRVLGNRDMQGGSVFISGDFGRLTMGDVDGAAERIVGDLAMTSLTGLEDLHENAFLSNRNGAARTAARYDYTIDGFTVSLSADEPNSVNNVYSIAAGYQFDGFGAGIGYEKMSGQGNHVIAYASGSFEGITVKATYGRLDSTQQAFLGVAERDQYGLSVTGSFDAITASAFVRRGFEGGTNGGVGASYDLGGGASLVGGVSRNGGVATDKITADFGLAFTF